MDQEEPKRRHGKRKKSLALKVADRDKLLEEAHELLIGFSISQLRRFLARKKLKSEQAESVPQTAEISPENLRSNNV